MANVVYLGGLFQVPDTCVREALKAAASEHFKDVLVIGRTAEGEMVALGSNGSAEWNFDLCEEFKYRLLAGEGS
jgi:hypothetical protein